MIGLVRVLTTDDEGVLQTHARVIEPLVRDRVVTRAIPDQPHGIHDDATLEAAVPKVIAVAEELAREGASRIVISCAADPAVTELRDLLPIPVIGAGSAAAAVARSYATRVGVLGITETVPSCVADLLGDALVGAVVPEGVGRTTDLMTPRGREAALAAARQLVDHGAQCVLFACTGLTTIGLADSITETTGVPVIDAVLAAGHTAAYPFSSTRSTHVHA